MSLWTAASFLVVGYVDGAPAGWISFGPRGDYAKLALAHHEAGGRARGLVCHVLLRRKRYRGKSVQHRLLDAAAWYVGKQGSGSCEAHRSTNLSVAKMTLSSVGRQYLYERAGLTEVVRRSLT